MKIPTFNTKKELFKFLYENKTKLIAQKKSVIKEADGFGYNVMTHPEELSEEALKFLNDTIETDDVNQFKVTAIINTTNIMDSHNDVHLPGIWTQTVKENKFMMHVQEHKSNQFDKIISDGNDLKPFIKYYTWKELGFSWEGKTQALVFNSIVKRDRNNYMFNQYAKGHVKNHSVGMRYVKLELAINNEDYKEEYAVWEKYIEKIINKEYAESKGYFWAVKEAKAIEGSAVPLGSNYVTPTYQITDSKNEIKDESQTEKSPKDALQEISALDYLKQLNNRI